MILLYQLEGQAWEDFCRLWVSVKLSIEIIFLWIWRLSTSWFRSLTLPSLEGLIRLLPLCSYHSLLTIAVFSPSLPASFFVISFWICKWWLISIPILWFDSLAQRLWGWGDPYVMETKPLGGGMSHNSNIFSLVCSFSFYTLKARINIKLIFILLFELILIIIKIL